MCQVQELVQFNLYWGLKFRYDGVLKVNLTKKNTPSTDPSFQTRERIAQFKDESEALNDVNTNFFEVHLGKLKFSSTLCSENYTFKLSLKKIQVSLIRAFDKNIRTYRWMYDIKQNLIISVDFVHHLLTFEARFLLKPRLVMFTVIAIT